MRGLLDVRVGLSQTGRLYVLAHVPQTLGLEVDHLETLTRYDCLAHEQEKVVVHNIVHGNLEGVVFVVSHDDWIELVRVSTSVLEVLVLDCLRLRGQSCIRGFYDAPFCFASRLEFRPWQRH